MYDFIVLGIIPGTQKQITFSDWLMAAAALVGAAVIWKTIRVAMRLNAKRQLLEVQA